MAKKPRANKYDEKLKVKGSFKDLLKALLGQEKKEEGLPKLGPMDKMDPTKKK